LLFVASLSSLQHLILSPVREDSKGAGKLDEANQRQFVEQIFSKASPLQAVNILEATEQEDDRGCTTGNNLFCRWTRTIEYVEHRTPVETFNVQLTRASEYYRQDVPISEATYMKLLSNPGVIL
jgi:hypothetical protein